MVKHRGCGHGRNESDLNKASSSSSSSSINISMSKKSLSSPVPVAPEPPSPCGHSMEEVWGDICLSANTSTLYHPAASNGGAVRGLFFQEFLPSSPGARRERSSGGDPQQQQHHYGSRHYCFEVASSFRPQLSQQGQEDDPAAGATRPEEYSWPSKASDSVRANVEFSILPKKRVSDDGDKRERKNQRLMKNRESAAKSRARKEAYTNELEEKLSKLKEENAKLRELCPAANSAQLPKKHTLSRTLTAPF